MDKNTMYRLYTAVFVGVCLIPSVLMPVIKGDSSKEKRVLAEKPHIKNEDGSLNFSFFKEFDDYFSEHFAFRQPLVTADGRMKSALLGTSPNSDVIVGKNGWLYYGETADDYLNINNLSERAINNICHNLDLVEKYCEQNNIDFTFFSAPNKNTVYPENMPFNYIPSESKDNLERISEKLADREYFLDMKNVLLSAESNIPLYHKTDTHWNNLGAYVGHVGIMNKLGRESCSSGTSWHSENNRLGDIAAMIYPSEKAKDTQIYNDYEFKYSYLGHFRGLDDISINTQNSERNGQLTMFRDSYGEAILPYMAECFESAEFLRSVPYNISTLSDRTLIIEIVERNLGNLQKYAPVMSAPKAEIPMGAELYVANGSEIHSETNGSFTHIFGEIPDYIKSDDIRIFITIGVNSYEAFNCFEDRLLKREGETSDRGFSLYIPNDEKTDISDITVSVMYN